MTKKQAVVVPAAAPGGFSIMSAEQKVAMSRTWLLRNRPMWGSLLMRLKIRERRASDPRNASMITDGRYIAWTRSFVDALSVEETTGVLAHEVGHCMLKHVFRTKGRDQKAWAEACDHVVNLLLLEDGFRLPDVDPFHDPEFKGMSAEQVYPIILARHEQQKQEEEEKQQQKKSAKSKQDPGEQSQQQSGGEEPGEQDGESEDAESERGMGGMSEPGTLGEGEDDSDADDEQQGKKGKPKKSKGKKEKQEPQQQSGEQSNEPQPEKEQGDGEGESEEGEPDDSDASPDEQAGGADAGGDDDLDTDDAGQEPGGDSGGDQAGEGAPLSEADQRDLENDWAQAAVAAAQQAVQRGHGSANQQRAVIASNAQPISFEDYVDYFLQRCKARAQESWRRQSRRSVASNIYLPGRRSTTTGPLVIGVDTSGSINEKALAKFIVNAQKAQQDLKPQQVIVIYADDEVMNEVRYEQGAEIEVKQGDAKGGGGTDFRPLFKRVKEIQETEGLEVAGVMYLTDLEGDMPKVEDALDYPPTLWCFDSSSCYSRHEHEELVKAVTFGEVAEIQI